MAGLKACGPYPYEFLFRGKPPGSDEPIAYHLTLEARVDNGHGQVLATHRQLSMAAAIEEGWTKDKIMAGFNAQLAAELEKARHENAVLTTTIEEQNQAAREVAGMLAGQRTTIERYSERAGALADQLERAHHDRQDLQRRVLELEDGLRKMAAASTPLSSRTRAQEPSPKNAFLPRRR